jgi:hypothetical protein
MRKYRTEVRNDLVVESSGVVAFGKGAVKDFALDGSIKSSG